MFFKLFFLLRDEFSPLNLFRYVSFRVIAAMITSLVICLLVYPWFIRKLQDSKSHQPIREDGPQTHFKKRKTPTMGGVLMLLAVVVSTLLWADLSNPYVGVLLVMTVGFGIVGFVDDAMKVRGASSAGFSGKMRLLIEFALAGGLMAILMSNYEMFGWDLTLYFPFVSTERFSLELPIWLYVPFAMVLIVGTGNSVNLTDGLDGLAIGPVIIAAATFLILAYGSGTVLAYDVLDASGELVRHTFDVATYLKIPRLPGLQELAIFCAAIIGAGLGFLWYNAAPALIFMGDVGSLALGRGVGDDGRGDQTRAALCPDLRPLPRRGAERHHPDRELQAHGQARGSHGPDPPPLREERLAGDTDRRPVLGHRIPAGAGGAGFPKDSIAFTLPQHAAGGGFPLRKTPTCRPPRPRRAFHHERRHFDGPWPTKSSARSRAPRPGWPRRGGTGGCC